MNHKKIFPLFFILLLLSMPLLVQATNFTLTPTTVTLTNTISGSQTSFNATIINNNNQTETYDFNTTIINGAVDWNFTVPEIEANQTQTVQFTITILQNFNQTQFQINIFDTSNNLRIIYVTIEKIVLTDFQLIQVIFIVVICASIILGFIFLVIKKVGRI